MPLVSIKEAAKRLNVDNRTLRRWIEKGSVEARLGINGILGVEESELARVERELRSEQRATRQDASLVSRIEALERTVFELEKQVESLKQEMLLLKSEPPPPVKPKTTQHTTPQSTGTRQNLPPGTITDAELADELGIHKRTLNDLIRSKANNLEDTAIFKRMRGSVEEYEHFFTPEQADRVRAYYKRRKG